MADNFAIYLPFQQMLPTELLQSLAPGATVAAGADQASIEWSDVAMRLSLMPMEQHRSDLGSRSGSGHALGARRV